VHWLELLSLAVGLAMDAFAVAVAAGVRLESVTPRHTVRLALHFGLFQFMTLMIGWLAGTRLSGFMGAYDQLVAFGLLSVVGGKMLWDACRGSSRQGGADPTRGLMLVTLSLATSIDALAVGVSMALLQRFSIWIPAAIIGLVAALVTAIGIQFGGRLGLRCGRWAEVAGGAVLILISLQPLVSYLTAKGAPTP
jgi:putative Mn2+ efflux pump MntP